MLILIARSDCFISVRARELALRLTTASYRPPPPRTLEALSADRSVVAYPAAKFSRSPTLQQAGFDPHAVRNCLLFKHIHMQLDVIGFCVKRGLKLANQSTGKLSNQRSVRYRAR